MINDNIKKKIDSKFATEFIINVWFISVYSIYLVYIRKIRFEETRAFAIKFLFRTISYVFLIFNLCVSVIIAT